MPVQARPAAELNVLHVCAEVYPWLKTGGLADVAAALPVALNRLGCDTRLLVPGFPALCAAIGARRLVAVLPARPGAAEIRLTAGTLPNGIATYVIEAPALYDRPGNPYAGAANIAYADNDRRFALLGWVAARLAQGLDTAWQPHVVHGHDWHAGMAPAYLRAAQRSGAPHMPGSVLTIHNLAYQGTFPAAAFGELGLPADFYGMNGVEFYGQVSFLKAGLYYADRITTVSPTYAREIQTAAQGCGLQGLLAGRAHDLTGILNGVDPAVWNPASDAAIAAHYDAASLAGKDACRHALQAETGLAPQRQAPLFGIISRLTDQKGLHLVLGGLPALIAQGAQLVLLGTGDAALEQAFRDAAKAHPSAISVEIGYDEDKAHRIVAGCDVILVPSRFEPCGLTQLYGLAYGTLPLVRRVGGLADSVVDASPAHIAEGSATGFVFDAFDTGAFIATLERAVASFARPQVWQALQQRAMRACFTWEAAAAQLLPLYRQIAPLPA